MIPMIFTTGHDVVDAIGKLHFEGNVIPHSWYQTMKLKNGKPDLIGMAILSDVVYWYRPTIVRNEQTGVIEKAKKKFKSDLLQRSYKNLQEQFGLTEKQSREALIRLEEIGVLQRVFRTIETESGKVPNVMFLELDSDKVLELTFPERKDVLPKKETGVYKEGNKVFTNLETRSSPEGTTNTEITTEITYTEITTDITSKPSSLKKGKDEHIPYGLIIGHLNKLTGMKFNPNANKNRDLIHARWGEGNRLEDFIDVIDKKVEDWKGTRFEQYLRPVTLFGNKFDGYKNERVTKSETNRGSDDIIKKYNLDVEREPSF